MTKSTPLAIACIGEAMIELSQADQPGLAHLRFAGDTLNAAIYLRRGLAGDHRVSFITALGRDGYSDQMIDMIAGEGIETDLIARHPDRLPGIYAISVDETGERSFSYWRDQSAARRLFSPDTGPEFAALDRFDVVYLSGITLAILPEEARGQLLDWITSFRAKGGRFAFDSNYRPRLWADADTARHWIGRAWGLCDIALPSVDDEMALFGDVGEAAVLARFRGYGAMGALKRGAGGPVAIGPCDLPSGSFAAAERVVDSTAAGDSFVGAFLASHLGGAPLGEAMQAGHDQAVRVIGHRGAILPRDEG
ncbi:sugar kinase [Oceaniglobus ichthyenteri]|uniref:sugar kinase n=1 Tax=Oceaniglobus ichthyenteri TaxID=2136177 RepID=UPI000D34CFCC|nr:sugar kinase [Oceaniglobus ichthyenteri]